MQPRMIVFSYPIVCPNTFSEFLVATVEAAATAAAECLGVTAELTDATVMMNNEPTDTPHRIWQSFPRCLGAT